MQEQFDLGEVAEAYFSVPTSDQPEYARFLIRARGRAIFPLLRAILTITAKDRKFTDNLARAGRDSAFGEEGARYIWAGVVMESMIQDAYDVARRIGQPAKAELCRALLERDYKMRLAAALLLAMDESPSGEVQRGIQEALSYIGLDKEQGALLSMLLGSILARAGDAKWQRVIEGHARDNGLNFEEWVERTVNTVLIELQKY